MDWLNRSIFTHEAFWETPMSDSVLAWSPEGQYSPVGAINMQSPGGCHVHDLQCCHLRELRAKPQMQLYGCTFCGEMETHMELRIWRGSQTLPTVHRAGVPPPSRDLLACDCLSIVGLPPTPVQRYLASFPPGPLFSVPEVVPFPNMDPSAQPPPFAMAPTSPTEA